MALPIKVRLLRYAPGASSPIVMDEFLVYYYGTWMNMVTDHTATQGYWTYVMEVQDPSNQGISGGAMTVMSMKR